jgi:hypothetical protein
MKFIALLKGQLKGILGAGMPSIFGLLGGGYFLINAFARFDRINATLSFQPSPLAMVGPLLIFISIVCGISMGTPFWMLGFRKTWYFLLHRSASRVMILISMITAAVITLVVFTGGCWTLLFLYASVPGHSILPPTPRVYLEGWLFISLGLVFFFGTALTGISTARLYTTRLFGIILAVITFIVIFMSLDIIWAFIVVALSILILASQVFYVFINRDF